MVWLQGRRREIFYLRGHSSLTMWTLIIELLQIIIPAVIVGLTAYYLIREMLRRQEQRANLQFMQSRQSTTLPLRLQAYERLSLLCERISPQGLLLRTRRDGLSAQELRAALLVAIQQEYEHNVTQQVYVSQQLWDIIKAARDDAAQLISMAAEPGGSGNDLAQRLLHFTAERGADPLATAQAAVRREAATLF